MNGLFAFCPQPPDWQLDWPRLSEAFAWIQNLAGCPQDSIHHAEGNVWIHTRMVCEALVRFKEWRQLSLEHRQILFAAALLHDVAKPECTRTEADGRISSRGHSRRGSILARRILWEMEVPFTLREQITALVRHHQVPYFLVDRPDAQRLAIEVSQTARCDQLALLAEADVRGRIAKDQGRLLDNVSLFREFCREEGCLSEPRRFASDHARFLYFRDERRHPDSPAHADFRAEVIVLSGLPGAGKDHWVRTHAPDWPVISLDRVREELDVDPTDNQGQVINEARERARDHLRSGTSFVWNATNLSRQLRSQCIDLLTRYGARIQIAYVEASRKRLLEQNQRREARVPQKVIERLLDRWEVPDLTESHAVDWVIGP